MKHLLSLAFVPLLLLAANPADAQQDKELTDLLKKVEAIKPTQIEPNSTQAKEQQAALGQFLRLRREQVNRRSSAAWQNIQDKEEWEKFRAVRLKALRESLGVWPEVPKQLNLRVTRTLPGEGYRLENVLFESRPGLWVTANLYSPSDPPASMPGLLICHSHHNPKSQGELQDMGMNWARQGCVVLIMDQIGHGERRQHPFIDASKFDQKFAVDRQDYYFRYNVGNQLHLIGDSQIGWMVWDLMRGVDLLLSRKGVDRNRMLLLGAVAGGGDPVAVTAALDERISAAVPFNFGGPQPETTFPLPKEADARFNYLGGGSWESTRGLRLSGSDGFLPWVIVGAIAPRGLIYAHEFAWDRDRDPVWQRLEKIYGWYGKKDWLSSAKGSGSVKGKPPESTHCNHIGPIHRVPIYATFQRWFDMKPPAPEFKKRLPAAELLCFNAELLKEIKPRTVAQLADQLAEQRLTAARQQRGKLPQGKQIAALRNQFKSLLGEVQQRGRDHMRWTIDKDYFARPALDRFRFDAEPSWRVDALWLDTGWQLKVPQPGDTVPSGGLLIRPENWFKKRCPVVVAVAQHGAAAFLKQRAKEIAALLKEEIAVCLVDVRGVGEFQVKGDSRGRGSSSTSQSATEQMLGGTMLGARLGDLRFVLEQLRYHPHLDGKRIALWGDSFAAENPAGMNLQVPFDAPKLPDQAEPLGGLLALFAALFEDDIKAVYVRGGLSGYRSLLQSQFAYVPHDALLPGVLTVGDLDDIAAALAPRAVRLEGLVTGLNQRASAAELAKSYSLTRAAYRAGKQEQRLAIEAEPAAPAAVARWFAKQLKAP